MIYLGLFFAGAVVSLLAAQSLSGTSRGFLLLCGALFRVTLLFRAPDLSEDLYRYLWDGRVARQGISPYRYAPDDPALQGLSSNLRAQLAHRDFRTVYPPVAQAVFRVVDGLHPLRLKAFFVAADLAVLALLFSLGGENATFAGALYAFHPLAVTEVAGQGHLDALGVALLLLTLALLRRRRGAAAGLALSASVLTKYVSLATVIPVFRRGRWACFASAAFLAAVVWLSASRQGSSPAGDLRQFAMRWDFNSVLYPGVVRAMEQTNLPETAKDFFIDWKERHRNPDWAQKVFPFFYPAFFARMFLAFGLAVVLFAIGWRVADPESAIFASLAALFLFSPVLQPWYLLWVLPFAARLREPAFLFLSFASPLSYGLLHPIPGASAALLLSLEYIPFAWLLGETLVRSRRSVARRAA